MIKLVRAKLLRDHVTRLEFSDGSWGDYDTGGLVSRDGAMVEPLKDPKFFKRFFIDEGALAWPNGLDLSAETLHSRLIEQKRLQRPRAAA